MLHNNDIAIPAKQINTIRNIYNTVIDTYWPKLPQCLLTLRQVQLNQITMVQKIATDFHNASDCPRPTTDNDSVLCAL